MKRRVRVQEFKISISRKKMWRSQSKLLGAILAVSFIAFIATFFSMQSTGNASIDLRQGSETIIKLFTDFASPFLETVLGVNSFGQYFFTKILLGFLIGAIVFTVFRNVELFSKHRGVQWILTLVVSILSIRYLASEELINAILLPYSALGLSITIFLPFLVYFYFVENSVPGSSGRRMAWILYAVFFGGLWYQRRAEIGNGSIYYFGGIIAIGISMMFDQQIHKFFSTRWEHSARRDRLTLQRANLLNELDKISDFHNTGKLSDSEYNRLKSNIERRISSITDELSKL